ncbi:MAG: hypothetical protein ACRCUY_07670 [Thermoguttaceae bacterium]
MNLPARLYCHDFIAMLTFWGTLSELDIDKYASILILPSYMSHLRRVPFQFDLSQANQNGHEPIVITYQGEGRIEEIRLSPKKHASALLCSICPALQLEQIQIEPCESKAMWQWSRDFGQEQISFRSVPSQLHESSMKHLFSPIMMRIYFEPISPEQKSETSHNFKPEIGYVSVSKRELFIGTELIQHYFAAWLEQLTGKSDSSLDPLPHVEPVSGGFRFISNQFGGELLLHENATFKNLLHFAKLDQSLRQVAEIVRIPFDSNDVKIDGDGIRFRLQSNVPEE